MATTRLHITLDTSRMSEADITQLVGTIQKVGSTSALQQDAGVHASFTALASKSVQLSASVATTAALAQQYKDSVEALGAARTQVESELGTLRTLVANKATSTSDITGMGFVPRVSATSSRTPPAAPAELLTRLSTKHGQARVSVLEPAGQRGSYVAESTPDPVGTASIWTSLPGTGKSRTITGATGAHVWVRFAQVRYGLQSDWSVPVLVTLP